VKIKLDENIHSDVVEPLREQGHDVATVHDEELAGQADADIAEAIKAEERCLVTFDVDFADPRRYPPAEFAGIIVLRLRLPTAQNQIERTTQFFAEKPEVAGHLWILEASRARDWTP
jgi:predicted nuclease of predicted toxin-antitoxin system